MSTKASARSSFWNQTKTAKVRRDYPRFAATICSVASLGLNLSIKIKVVFKLNVLRDKLQLSQCRNKLQRLSRFNGFFGQTVFQRCNDLNIGHLAGRRQYSF